MGLNHTPSSERVHIGVFGRRNVGKSSIVNAITGQDLAVVSEVRGTTTDPVQKAMELLPVGPVVLIDTPGIDDEGTLGELRVQKTRQILNKTDVAILVADGAAGMSEDERELIRLFEEKEIPYLIAVNKADLTVAGAGGAASGQTAGSQKHTIQVSAKTGFQIQELKEAIAACAARKEPDGRLVGDLLSPQDFVLLVVPIDKAAPKGRLILPQQQTIRDILESRAVAVVVKETEVGSTLRQLGKAPALAITDSQVFARVSKEVPEDIPLTSFSILFARYKGNLKAAIQGAAAIETLKDGDTVLISEGCTHHRQCGDIGSVKLPGWLSGYTKKQIHVALTSGTEFPSDLSGYQLVIHCGGCMLNEREMKYRLGCAKSQGVPMTNYGIAIAYMQGILKRSVKMFPDLAEGLPE